MSLSPLLVVLDLDETLMHSANYEIERALGPSEHRLGGYHMYARPGAQSFLAFLLNDDRFKVAVWTSATADYAQSVVQWLFPKDADLELIFSRDNLVRRQSITQLGWDVPFGESTGVAGYLKDLQKIAKKGYPLTRMVAIDDVPRFFQRQYSNLIRVPEWHGEKEDGSLFAGLQDYLADLAQMPNVRECEKRGWMNRYCPGFEQGPDPLVLLSGTPSP